MVLHALLDGHLVFIDDPEDQAGAGRRGGRAGASFIEVGRLRDDQHGRAEGLGLSLSPSLPLNHIVSTLCPLVTVRLARPRTPGHGWRGRDFRRREGVEPRVQVELDDGSDELGRERELRRQRSGEGLEMGAFVVLEATGVENPAQVWVFAETQIKLRYGRLLWKLRASA